jgi:hypothetical protein
VAGADQINGFPCTQSVLISGCVDLATPLQSGQYILLRWTDVNDPNNDHHMAIDDVQVDFDVTGGGCNVLLPIELIHFSATAQHERVMIEWTTASENDNAYFTIERGIDGVDFAPLVEIPGNGTTQAPTRYRVEDTPPSLGSYFYRLRQTDTNGASSVSPTVIAQLSGPDEVIVQVDPAAQGEVQLLFPGEAVGRSFALLDVNGRLLRSGIVSGQRMRLHRSAHSERVLFLTLDPHPGSAVRIVFP